MKTRTMLRDMNNGKRIEVLNLPGKCIVRKWLGIPASIAKQVSHELNLNVRRIGNKCYCAKKIKI